MKLTLTLLFLVGFIAFIGAVPEEAQDAPVADPEKETAAEDASPDEQDKNEDDEFHADQVPIEGSEAEQDEDADLDMPEQELKEGEQDADEENDPRRRLRCYHPFRVKRVCHTRNRRRQCWLCCVHCHHRHHCRPSRKACFFRRVCRRSRGGRRYCFPKLVCYRIQYKCSFWGRCYYKNCRRHRKG